MNLASHENASYVPSGGIRVEKKRRQEQWDEYQRQQQAQRASISEIPEEQRYQALTSRKRADSHQYTSSMPRSRQSVDIASSEHVSAHLRSSYDYGYVSNRLLPQFSISHPQGEIRRLSGNFNAPTHVELEGEREHRKSLKGVEKLRSKLKGLVRP